MRIGELAERTGLAASRIRFYEASGLIAAQRHGNGYREYRAEALRRLELITAAQSAGFTLDEVRRLLPATDQDRWQHDQLLDGLRAKVAEIEVLQQRLRHNRTQLLAVIAQIENKPEGLLCTDNAERVMAQVREARATRETPAAKAASKRPAAKRSSAR